MRWMAAALVAAGALLVGAAARRPSGARGRFLEAMERLQGQQNGVRLKALPRQREEAMHLHDLPADASLLAQQCADHLQLDSAFEEHFERLLASVSAVNGVEAVGYAVWRKPKMPPFLSIYALSDFTGMREEGNCSPRPHVATKYDEFQSEMQSAAGGSVFTELAHVNTRRQTVEDVATRFPDRLRDPFAGKIDPHERSSLARLAICTPATTASVEHA